MQPGRFALTVASLVLAICSHDVRCSNCDGRLRERYCHPGDAACLRCEVGPYCPVAGRRASPEDDDDGTSLMRGAPDGILRQQLLRLLDDERRGRSATGGCLPVLAWDAALADVAQAWADQCALVEYGEEREPRALRHDARRDVAAAESGHLTAEAGVAQSVHWARTDGGPGMGATVLAALVASRVRAEQGTATLDGVAVRDDDNAISFGHATHVGCGWIQFSLDGGARFDNFMVCNYGVGRANGTDCRLPQTEEGGEQPNATDVVPPFITYYSASDQVIRDVKTCLGAVRCKRRQLGLFQDKLDVDNEGRGCSGQVDRCLESPSGMRFLPLRRLRSFARSSDGGRAGLSELADVEASRCKIDTILCSLGEDDDELGCGDRVGRCLPLLEASPADDSTAVNGNGRRRRPLLFECECLNGLVLSDGTRGGCHSDERSGPQEFCFVKKSPCIALGANGEVEMSTPERALGSLIHKSYLTCSQPLDPK